MLCQNPRSFNKKFPDAVHGCGGCLPCRVNQRRVWAHRLMLESFCHEDNSFLTLTYSDDHLPTSFVNSKTGQVYADNSVNPDHHRLFINRFRTAFYRKYGRKLRFFAVGEYGEDTFRPHYHYALFGYPPCANLEFRKLTRNFKPCNCPVCSFVSQHWGYGHIFLGDLNHESSNYVAGYVTKKLTSDNSDFQSNILAGRHPEFSRSSNRPGIGSGVIDIIATQLTLYGKDVKNELPNFLLHGSKQLPLGRYLTNKLQQRLEITYDDNEKIKDLEKRMRSMLLHNRSNSQEITKAAGNSLQIAMQFLKSQDCHNLTTRFSIFNKGNKL